ncbi:phosphoribosyltransferase [Undibacterium sp.]|jgi:hypoxanthine phosphoribosyltransferase|uniref:phosphoribosyltransferase n=1 Tax=Undibacterium sp. TaxID=1914977 RepID=UPI002BAF008D|nr:phosphoribosyltransferase [Undibacterium sp.]HTD04993.1 phosphoribosyltransferase [Undibacterium sp.]
MNKPVSDDKHLWVSWDAYHRSIEQLASKVHESGWKFDQVLCLARGGLRPGDIFSRIFDVPLAILSTSSYREESGTVQGQLDIGKYISMTKGALEGKVLVVDDLVDSGVTLEKVLHHLRENFPAVTDVKSAVIWCKGCSSIKPDFYLDYLPSNPWIHQPFEEYDSIRPHQLNAWLKKGASKE